MNTTDISHDVKALAQFQRDAASYFEHRPTNGEDMAHFANVYNAANCRATADALAASEARISALEALLKEAEGALERIKRLKPKAIGDTGFQTGPLALLGQAQRIATATLTKLKEARNG